MGLGFTMNVMLVRGPNRILLARGLTFLYLDRRSLAIMLYCYHVSIVNVGFKEISCCCTAFLKALYWHLVANMEHTHTHTQVNNYGFFFLTLWTALTLTLFPFVIINNKHFLSFHLQIVDTLFIGRYVLLAVASVVFLVAFFMLLPFHFLEPVYAKALRTH